MKASAQAVLRVLGGLRELGRAEEAPRPPLRIREEALVDRLHRHDDRVQDCDAGGPMRRSVRDLVKRGGKTILPYRLPIVHEVHRWGPHEALASRSWMPKSLPIRMPPFMASPRGAAE